MRIVNSFNVRVAALALAAASLFACSDTTGPGESQPAELSEVLAESSQPTLPAVEMLGSGMIPLTTVSSTGAVPFTGCSYDAGSQSFVCARVTSGGLTIDRSYTLFDAAGNRQSQFVRGGTAAVQTKVHVAGTLTAPFGTHTIDQSDDRTVSGLLTSRHVLNGTSTHTMSGTFSMPGGTQPPMTMSSMGTTKIESLVLPSKENRWPGPGTMTTTITSTSGGIGPSTSTMRAVFDGTKCVTYTISFGDYTQTRVVDMSNPRVPGCTP
jgi:hypothetical protein